MAEKLKCKCAMCGKGRPGRASYIRAGILTFESSSKGAHKVRERRVRRRREKRAAFADLAG